MIPLDKTQTLETIGTVSKVAFYGATAKTMPRIFNALSDKIYKHKIRAVVREYSTNAMDEHIKFNLPISDIIVELPTIEDPAFKIRDFGAGLSEDEIANIYCIFGESTKRNSNSFNGQLGLGCKAAFAYGDSFLVTSFHNGTKTIYNSIRGDNEKAGEVVKISQSPMSSDDKTGVSVEIPVKIEDIYEFNNEAEKFYKYWKEIPTLRKMINSSVMAINNWKEQTPYLSGDNWEIRSPKNENGYGVHGGYAYMGGVAYPIDWNVLYSKLNLTPQNRSLLTILTQNNVVLYFDIGSIEFTISREDLEYTQPTLDALKTRLNDIFDRLIQAIKDKISNAPNLWEAKKLYGDLFCRGTVNEDDNYKDHEQSSAVQFIAGDLYKLKDAFLGQLQWKGTDINSPAFTDIHHYDLVKGYCNAFGTSPTDPCLVTYKKNDQRVKHLHCSDTENNRIVASHKYAVVINDLCKKSLSRSVARYLIFKNDSKISKVYILRFKDSNQLNAFYKEYNFYSVPIIYLSSIVQEVKAFNSTTRGNNSGKSGAPVGTRKVNHLELSVFGSNLNDGDQTFQDLEDGGYFIAFEEKQLVHKGRVYDAKELSKNLYVIANALNMNIDRIYAINSQNRNAKWFQEAVEDGVWINILDYIKDNINKFDKKSLKITLEHRNVCSNSNFTLTKTFVKKVVPHLIDKENPINKLVSIMDENSHVNLPIIRSLDFFGLSSALKLNIIDGDGGELKDILQNILSKYPLLGEIQHLIGTTYALNDNQLPKWIEYINAIDLLKSMKTFTQTKSLTVKDQTV